MNLPNPSHQFRIWIFISSCDSTSTSTWVKLCLKALPTVSSVVFSHQFFSFPSGILPQQLHSMIQPFIINFSLVLLSLLHFSLVLLSLLHFLFELFGGLVPLSLFIFIFVNKIALSIMLHATYLMMLSFCYVITRMI